MTRVLIRTVSMAVNKHQRKSPKDEKFRHAFPEMTTEITFTSFHLNLLLSIV